MTWPLLDNHASIIHPFSLYSIGSRLCAIGNRLDNAAGGTMFTADQIIYVPFWLTSPMTVTHLFCWNGAAASGNIDLGIYSFDGIRLVSTGSTAQAGTSTLQIVDITDTVLAPGQYYMACVIDNTTGTFFRVFPTARTCSSFGCFLQLSTFPLPAIATFATAVNIIPVMGLTNRAVL